MLKETVRVADHVKAEREEIDPPRRIPVGPENKDEIAFESRWTPVAFTLALTDAESEV